MKKNVFMLSLTASLMSISPVSHAELNSFLKGVNSQAVADSKTYNNKLSRQFGVPMPEVDSIVRSVLQPADAFMILQISQMTRKAPEAVLHTYQRSKGKGWGTIARELGIKPGSPEFHALRRGDLRFTGERSRDYPVQQDGRRGQWHGNGKGKGHEKD